VEKRAGAVEKREVEDGAFGKTASAPIRDLVL
jgi:hypothetical protein